MIFGRSFKLFREKKIPQRKIPRIMCTLGKTTDDIGVLAEMINSGMAAARINTAYATIPEYKQRIDVLRSLRGAISKIPVVLDLKGSQIRLVIEGSMPGKINKFSIAAEDEFPIGFQKGLIAFNYNLSSDIMPGDQVLFENGTIRTIVAEKKEKYAKLKVIEAGEGYIRHGMGVNVPGKLFRNIPRLSPKDFEVIDFAFLENVEYIAISFVRESEDVFCVKRELEKKSKGIILPKIIIKIEDPIGIKNLPTIINDARKEETELMVMIGRGDMFVESPKYMLGVFQKEIISVCKKNDTTVIVATGLLESMQFNRYPTRSEVCDVTNSVLDEPDWLMLSAETANSDYPVEAVKMLQSIINECEKM